jgi:hypothetical protein
VPPLRALLNDVAEGLELEAGTDRQGLIRAAGARLVKGNCPRMQRVHELTCHGAIGSLRSLDNASSAAEQGYLRNKREVPVARGSGEV